MARALLPVLLSACGSGGGDGGGLDTPPPAAPVPPLGQAQKGPFQADSPVTLYRLDDGASRTGESTAVRTGELGWFTASVPWSGLTEFEIEGDFFDESTGTVSAQTLRLTGLARLPAAGTVRINLYSHLAAARVRTLMASGDDYQGARDTAYAELRTLFQLLASESDRLARLDLTDGSSADAADNANLLLLSAALLAAGVDQAGLDTLAADFAADGVMDAAPALWLRVTVYAGTVDLDQVRARLETLASVDRAPGFDALGNRYPAWVNLAGDADADGVPDRDEMLVYQTDPLSADSDGDSMPDGWEVAAGLDPLLDDAAADPDGDGLGNAAEFEYRVDPRIADSDGDSWLDGFEVAAGGDPGDAASLPLVFLSSPVTAVETGFDYSYAAQVTWSGVNFSLDQAPPGVTVDSANGVVSWTPGLAQLGDFDLTLRASAAGYSATQSFVISTSPGNTGDINEDGALDARDILLGQRLVLGLVTPDAAQQVRGDLSADGVLGGADVVRLERLVMNLQGTP